MIVEGEKSPKKAGVTIQAKLEGLRTREAYRVNPS